jgi:hypothetical protein
MERHFASCALDGRGSGQRLVGDESFGTLNRPQMNCGAASYSAVYMLEQGDGLRVVLVAEGLCGSARVLTGEFVRCLAVVLKNPPPHNLRVGLRRPEQGVCRAAFDRCGKIYFEMSSKPGDTLARITRLYDRQASLSGRGIGPVTARGFDCFRAPGVLDRERGTGVAERTRGPGQTPQLLNQRL